MSDSSTDIEVDVDVDVEGEVEEDALATLFEHFTAVTSIDPPMIRGPGTPSQERYDDEWVLPLQDILTQAKGDLDLAKKAIEIAVERQDEDGYNVSCPQSIRKNSIGALRTYHDNEGTFDEGGLAAW